MINSEYDVIVIGGGTAGVIAAVQAGRAKVRTLLIEKNGMLGGAITSSGVSFPGIFHAWGKQIIAGIGWELVSQCVKEGNGIMPNPDAPQRQHWLQHAKFDGALYGAFASRLARRASVIASARLKRRSTITTAASSDCDEVRISSSV